MHESLIKSLNTYLNDYYYATCHWYQYIFYDPFDCISTMIPLKKLNPKSLDILLNNTSLFY